MRVLPHRWLASLLLGVSLTACAPLQTEGPIRPVSYTQSRGQLPRTVGLLRRLVVVQLRLVPAPCHESTEGRGRFVPVDAAARQHLERDKGYELVDIAPPESAEAPALAADLLAASLSDRPPGASLSAWIATLRDVERVDGVLLLRQEIVCLAAKPAARGLMALFSLGVSEVVSQDRADPMAEYVDATVFESATGRRVWRQAYGALEQEFVKPPMNLIDPRQRDALHAWMITHVLEPLEPALPRLLTR